jgi:hypothetical protein
LRPDTVTRSTSIHVEVDKRIIQPFVGIAGGWQDADEMKSTFAPEFYGPRGSVLSQIYADWGRWERFLEIRGKTSLRAFCLRKSAFLCVNLRQKLFSPHAPNDSAVNGSAKCCLMKTRQNHGQQNHFFNLETAELPANRAIKANGISHIGNMSRTADVLS